MSGHIVDLRSIPEENSQIGSYFQGYFENSASEINLVHHQLRNLVYNNHLIGSDDIGDDDSGLLDLAD